MRIDTIREYIRRAFLSVPFAHHLFRRKPDVEHGEKGIRQVGHREYIGGGWEELGMLQFEFLVDQGLEPDDYLLDIACGSLRAGVHLIPYLEEGHYLGIDKEEKLIKQGVEEELGLEIHDSKSPQFVVSDSFEFERFDARPDFAIAQSLFTHLPSDKIHLCFQNLRNVIQDEGVFYATFFRTRFWKFNRSEPHDHASFFYTRSEIEDFGRQNGWKPRYIEDWDHPRGQVMMEYRPD